MKSNRPAPPDVSARPRTTSARGGWFSGWTSFWFSAVPPSGLHWLRILSGVLFLFWLLPFAGHQMELFGLAGWTDKQAYLDMPQPPGWSLVFLCGDSSALVQMLYWEAIVVFSLFTLGVATRTTSVLTWALVISFMANPATNFDADYLLVMLALYLMIGYILLGQWNGQLSIVNRFGFVAALGIGALIGLVIGLGVGLGTGMVVGIAVALVIGVVAEMVGRRGSFLSPWGLARNADPSYAANLALRLIQVHFAIVVLTSGLHKLQFSDWWSGVALWYPLHNPFTMTAERLRSEAQNADATLFFLGVAQYIMLAWQLTFPFFAWRPRWRWLVLSGGVLAWIGLIVIYGEPLFGPIYLIGCLSFLPPSVWQALTDGIANLVPGATGSERDQGAKKVSVRA